MKRDELIALGLDETQVTAVMKIHGLDEARHQEKLEAEKALTEKAEGELTEVKKDLEKLRRTNVDNGELQKTLEARQARITELEADLKKIRTDAAIERAVSAAGAKDSKVILKLIDTAAITQKDDGSFEGLDAQIKALREDLVTGTLFNGEEKARQDAYRPASGAKVVQKVSYGKQAAERQKQEDGVNPFFKIN